MTKSRDEEQYTKPELRQKIKDELMQSDKGGKKGQWSARKSQLLVQEYEKQGGGYKGKKDEAAKSLEKWTDEDWQTKDGHADTRHDGETSRYLPKEVWEKLSPQEKKEAEQKKVKGSKKGDQHVANTPAVKRAKAEAEKEHKAPSKADLMKQAQKLGISGRSKMNKDALQKAIEAAK
ncbi:DUF5872 domain-containing protein [Rufibacter hautae]|uniref:DUF5872 domain-containing protein n=1 Tax=Rufibacter hautae TaxID=2595005 RepID=A0A5B6THI6_9BACT|nr:DUF5872 domain-containing protein [Rufibacter hautae]KAA3438714.1 hypothetical protein FOA19_15960 [Rufibacter hautae]